MITQLTIENFKCFSHKQTFNLSNLNIFAGVNGRGKSSAFQILLLLAQSLNKNGNINHLCTNGDFVKLSHFKDLLNSELESNDVIRIEIDTNDNEYKNIYLGYKEKNEWNGEICELKISGTDYFTSVGEIGANSGQSTNERFLQFTYPQMNKLFSPYFFISASRLGPTLYEDKQEEEDFNPLGAIGEKRLAVLASHSSLNSIRFDNSKTTSLLEEVNKWCNYIMSGLQLDLNKTENTIQLRMKNKKTMQQWAKSVNMGFGYSYILSIIIISLIAEKGSVVFIENPEAHLHPLAQARLMELLTRLAMTEVQVHIETHSEHIINSTRLYCLQEDKNITQKNISIYFFDELFKVHELKIDNKGQIPEWPAGFFDLQEQQLMQILQLGLMKG